MTDRTAGPGGALARLLETEARLEAKVAEADARAVALVAEAEARAAAVLAAADEAVALVTAESGLRQARHRQARIAELEADAEQRIALYRDLPEARIRELAEWVVGQVVGAP